MTRCLYFIAGLLLLSGCSIMNPYESEFSCPGTYKGKCISVDGAYKESVDANKEKESNTEGKYDAQSEETSTNHDDRTPEEACSQYNNSDDPVNTYGACVKKYRKEPKIKLETKELQNYNRYRSALYDKFGNLLKEPNTPVVSPPKTMRVLLLPYTGQDNEFYMLRYVYFFVDEPRWILGDSITADEGEE